MNPIENLSLRSISVWKRNRDVFFRTWKTNFVPSFLEPVLYLLAMGMGFGVLISEDLRLHDIFVSYIEFLAPGLVAISIMYGAFFECTYGSFVRMHYQKTFDAMIATPLSIEDVIVGEILWGATKSFLNATIVLIVISLFGLTNLPGLIFVPFIAFLGGLMFASIAMLFTSITPNMDSFNWPFFLLITPMFLFSGTFFPMYVLPEWGQLIALALPLTHCSVLVRDLCFNYFDLADVGALIYIAMLTVVAFFASIHLMKKRLIN